MLDIRIVEVHHEQPMLFGAPLVITTYRLVDWETEQSVDTRHHDSMGAAERASYAVLRPYLSEVAEQEAERNNEDDS
jgi:hypothetical protein